MGTQDQPLWWHADDQAQVMHELQPEVYLGIVPSKGVPIGTGLHQLHYSRHVCVNFALLDQYVMYTTEGELSQVVLSREQVKDGSPQPGGGEGRTEGTVIPGPLSAALKQAESHTETQGLFEEDGGVGEIVGPSWSECVGQLWKGDVAALSDDVVEESKVVITDWYSADK